MKSFYQLVAFILLSVNIYAQQDYFNRRYDFNQSAIEAGKSILLTDSGSISVFATTNSIGLSGTLKVGLLLLNDTGLIQGSSIYSIPNHKFFIGGYGALLKISNQTLILPGGTTDTLGNDDALITRFDSLNITWQHSYGDTQFQAGRAIKKTRDSGFILIGDEGPYNSSNSDVLMIKTDSNGIEQWTRNYGGQYSELGLDLDTCYDGGAILCGRTRSFGIGASIFWGNAYAIKTDSAGNEIWSRTFGHIYEDRFWSCLQASDGNYVFAGFYTYYDPYWPNYCCRSFCKPYIVKLDTAGNTIWAKVYGEEKLEFQITSIKELANGDYISAGFLVDTSTTSFDYKGFILKTTSNGDSLWYRDYVSAFGPNSDSYLYDIAPDYDGGLLATGWVVPQIPDTGNQDIWILKVDSLGCEVANCLYTSTGEIIKNASQGVNVYPNPSTGIFYFQNNSNQETEKCELFDYTGKSVLNAEGAKDQIDLNSMAKGIYFYRVEMRNGNIYKGKLIKE